MHTPIASSSSCADALPRREFLRQLGAGSLLAGVACAGLRPTPGNASARPSPIGAITAAAEGSDPADPAYYADPGWSM